MRVLFNLSMVGVLCALFYSHNDVFTNVGDIHENMIVDGTHPQCCADGISVKIKL